MSTYPYFYLSFCDVSRPEGEQFIGACMVPGDSMEQAVDNSWKLGCNPGGDVMGLGPVNVAGIPFSALHRLLSLDSMTQLGIDMGYSGDDLELLTIDEALEYFGGDE